MSETNSALVFTRFSGIPPAELHRKAATLSLARRSLESSLKLYNYINRPTTSNRLDSRIRFVIEIQDLLAHNINVLMRIYKT